MNTKTYLLNGFCLCQLFVNTFTLTFIAEWGDRSQLATIVLAGINDVVRGVKKENQNIFICLQVGVILGGCLGHAICTGGAVLAGALIARCFFWRKQLVGTTLYIICMMV